MDAIGFKTLKRGLLNGSSLFYDGNWELLIFDWVTNIIVFSVKKRLYLNYEIVGCNGYTNF